MSLLNNKTENGGYVYFIRDGLGHIKIGVATNVKTRIAQLQTANPMKLDYYYGMHVKTVDDAYEIERELHSKFSKDRLMGEWFNENSVLNFLRQPNISTQRYSFQGATW